jgi:hypothetical protein
MDWLKTYISQVLQDTNGSYSSKRAVTFLCVFLMAMAFVANLFWKYSVDEFMYNSVMYIVIAGLGFSGAEKFAPNKGGQQ